MSNVGDDQPHVNYIPLDDSTTGTVGAASGTPAASDSSTAAAMRTIPHPDASQTPLHIASTRISQLITPSSLTSSATPSLTVLRNRLDAISLDNPSLRDEQNSLGAHMHNRISTRLEAATLGGPPLSPRESQTIAKELEVLENWSKSATELTTEQKASRALMLYREACFCIRAKCSEYEKQQKITPVGTLARQILGDFCPNDKDEFEASASLSLNRRNPSFNDLSNLDISLQKILGKVPEPQSDSNNPHIPKISVVDIRQEIELSRDVALKAIATDITYKAASISTYLTMELPQALPLSTSRSNAPAPRSVTAKEAWEAAQKKEIINWFAPVGALDKKIETLGKEIVARQRDSGATRTTELHAKQKELHDLQQQRTELAHHIHNLHKETLAPLYRQELDKLTQKFIDSDTIKKTTQNSKLIMEARNNYLKSVLKDPYIAALFSLEGGSFQAPRIPEHREQQVGCYAVNAISPNLHANRVHWGETTCTLSQFPTADQEAAFFEHVIQDNGPLFCLASPEELRTTSTKLGKTPPYWNKSTELPDGSRVVFEKNTAITNPHFEQYAIKITKDSQTQEIPFFICTAWKDHEGTSPEVLDALYKCMDKNPPTIHCWAGTGRSGTFAAYNAGRKKFDVLQKDSFTEADIDTFVNSIAINFALQRHGAIENSKQLEALRTALKKHYFPARRI